jgi:signal transduction histidine kinase
VAHDIKNPLIGAEMVLDHLCSQSEEKLGDRACEMLNVLRDSNKSLLGLVQNLVDVYHYETLGYPIACEEVNLQATMDGCIHQNKYFCDSRQVKIRVSEMSSPLVIYADKIGVSRVFMNLLHNAVKFSQPGGSIEVSITRIGGEKVEIAVSDTGDGISSADQEKLFQRFGQADAGRSKANSSGLGLYLSRQIINGHHGQIGCKSEVGVGSTFFVRLPINQPDRQNDLPDSIGSLKKSPSHRPAELPRAS